MSVVLGIFISAIATFGLAFPNTLGTRTCHFFALGQITKSITQYTQCLFLDLKQASRLYNIYCNQVILMKSCYCRLVTALKFTVNQAKLLMKATHTVGHLITNL